MGARHDLSLERIQWEFIERRMQRIESELRRMCRGLRQSADRRDQGVALEGSRFVQSMPRHQLSQSRRAGHRGHTSLGLEADLSNAPGFYFQRQTKHIPTSGILELCHGVGIRHVTGVTRILKVIEQLRGIHTAKNCKCAAQNGAEDRMIRLLTSAFGEVNCPAMLASCAFQVGIGIDRERMFGHGKHVHVPAGIAKGRVDFFLDDFAQNFGLAGP